ncbi:MAG TPA: NUDIX hydrolase [Pirellulales bacterium]|nr:NUDIX hydrolase [Pirellulales bacterium]
MTKADREVLFVARRFRVVRRIQQTADGVGHDRDVVEHAGAVAIVPIVGTDQVCLIRTVRIAVDATLWEIPAGTLEPDEPPLENARRELIEETGYRCQKLEKIAELWMSPGILNERMHLFVASGLLAGPTALEAGEEIESVVVAWDEALAMIDRGEIQDAKTVAGLLVYDRIRRKEGSPPTP